MIFHSNCVGIWMRSCPPSPDALQAVGQRLQSSPYALSPDEVKLFWQDGALGPRACHAPELGTLLQHLNDASSSDLRASSGHRNVYDPQLKMVEIGRLAGHPSIVHPVAQLLGTTELSFFQARFRVKAPGRLDSQPWHQDVGRNHGGLRRDGSPIPSLTVWISLDGADEISGCVVMLPGTHHTPIGHWQAGFHGLKDLQEELDTTKARNLSTPKGHFQILHSWSIHCSRSNASQRPRSALILRYMARRHALDVSFPHHPCGVGEEL